MMLAGTEDFLEKYQARAGAEGVDPLGYYLGTWGYAYIQMLGDAMQATKSLDDEQARRLHRQDDVQDHHGRHQVRQGRRVGEVRMLQVQYHGIKRATASISSRGMATQTVLTPAEYKTGNVIYPFEKAK